MEKNGTKKILVVDDEPTDRALLRKVLSKNYIVIEASVNSKGCDSHMETAYLLVARLQGQGATGRITTNYER